MQVATLQSVNYTSRAKNKDFKPNLYIDKTSFSSLNVKKMIKSNTFKKKFLQSFSDATGIIRKRIEYSLTKLAESFKSDKLPEVSLTSMEIPEDGIIKVGISYPKRISKLAKQLGYGDTMISAARFLGADNISYHATEAIEQGYQVSQKIGKKLSRINTLLNNSRLIRKAVYSQDCLDTFAFLKEKSPHNLEIFERFLLGANEASEKMGEEQTAKLISLSVKNAENPFIKGQYFKNHYDVNAKFLVEKKLKGKKYPVTVSVKIKEPMRSSEGNSPALIGAIQENTKQTILTASKLAESIQKREGSLPQNSKFQKDGFIVDIACNH